MNSLNLQIATGKISKMDVKAPEIVKASVHWRQKNACVHRQRNLLDQVDFFRLLPRRPSTDKFEKRLKSNTMTSLYEQNWKIWRNQWIESASIKPTFHSISEKDKWIHFPRHFLKATETSRRYIEYLSINPLMGYTWRITIQRFFTFIVPYF